MKKCSKCATKKFAYASIEYCTRCIQAAFISLLYCFGIDSMSYSYASCALHCQNKMNSTEVQNPRCKLDDKCLCWSYVFRSVLASMCKVCSLVSEAFLLALWTLSPTTLLQTLRLFYVSLCSQATQQQYIVHCIHYGTVGIPF